MSDEQRRQLSMRRSRRLSEKSGIENQSFVGSLKIRRSPRALEPWPSSLPDEYAESQPPPQQSRFRHSPMFRWPTFRPCQDFLASRRLALNSCRVFLISCLSGLSNDPSTMLGLNAPILRAPLLAEESSSALLIISSDATYFRPRLTNPKSAAFLCMNFSEKVKLSQGL